MSILAVNKPSGKNNKEYQNTIKFKNYTEM
jgi:hypothetical protein